MQEEYQELIIWRLMLFDVLSGIDSIKICYAYELDGKKIQTIPATNQEYSEVVPLYIEMPGWTEDISNVTSFEELPLNAQNYIRKIERANKKLRYRFSL